MWSFIKVDTRFVTSDSGWPWGENKPTRIRRILVAMLVATVAASLIYGFQSNLHHSDFSRAWFAARALLDHQDPYTFAGPTPDMPFRWRYPLNYPATAFVAVMPLTPFSEKGADMLFVGVSVFALVYGMTARSWHLLPLVPSFSFFLNVQRAQWTILTTAMLFLPSAAFFVLTKPQFAFPPVAASENSRFWYAALIGGAVLLAVSLLFLPTWPAEWLYIVRHDNTVVLQAPITRPLGFLIPLVLLRWKHREAWFVFFLSCVPQTWDYYNTLPLLALAATYREACLLSLVSSLGGFVWFWSIQTLATTPQEGTHYGAFVIVLFAYLPTVLVILRRPNEGIPPVWLRFILMRPMRAMREKGNHSISRLSPVADHIRALKKWEPSE
jgi:hypothetical protein